MHTEIKEIIKKDKCLRNEVLMVHFKIMICDVALYGLDMFKCF